MAGNAPRESLRERLTPVLLRKHARIALLLMRQEPLRVNDRAGMRLARQTRVSQQPDLSGQFGRHTLPYLRGALRRGQRECSARLGRIAFLGAHATR
jgi:hypothetical protein